RPRKRRREEVSVRVMGISKVGGRPCYADAGRRLHSAANAAAPQTSPWIECAADAYADRMPPVGFVRRLVSLRAPLAAALIALVTAVGCGDDGGGNGNGSDAGPGTGGDAATEPGGEGA